MTDLPAARRRRAWLAAAGESCSSAAGRLAVTQGFVLTCEQARACGHSSADLRRLVHRSEWTAPHRGTLCVLAPPAAEHLDAPHGLRPEVWAAAVALGRPDAAISHECAALAHGLEVLRAPRRATLTTHLRMHSVSRHDAVVRAAGLDEEDLAGWFGTRITTCARTVVDLARTSGFAHGLVAADSALFNEVMGLDELAVALDRAYRWHGVVAARRLFELATPHAESPLESLVRLLMDDHEVPLPRPQALVPTDLGTFRVDGLWDDERVVLEADGMLKYRVDTEDEAHPLITEKRRQEAIERAGYRVVRVMWSDLRQPERTIWRINQARRR